MQRNDIVPAHVQLNRIMRGDDWQPPAGFGDRLKVDGRMIIHVKTQRVSGTLES